MARAADSWVLGASERLGVESRSVRATRLKAAAPRFLLAGTMVILVALGLRALVWPVKPPAPVPPPAAADAPSEDFALQFARAYLTYDADHPGWRGRMLAPFVSEQVSKGAGFFVSHGSQRVLWEEVVSDQAALAGGRVITVAAAVSTQRLPVYLAVTVRHRSGEALELMGYPSFVGAPAATTEVEVPSRESVEDPAVVAVVERVMRNYLSGSVPNLKADLTNDAVVTLPTVSLHVESVDHVVWIGAPESGAVLVTVTVSDTRGATYTLTYELGIAYHERPYVNFIEVIPTGG